MLVRLEEFATREFRNHSIRWPGLSVVSGYRTPEQNRAVGGAKDSLHVRCPALAVDLRVGAVAGLDDQATWAILGGKWRLMGGRWGGTFRTPDWNHFDLGV